MQHHLRIWLSLCAWLGLASILLAQSPPPAAIGWGKLFRQSQPLAVSNTPHPAVARITVQERDGMAFGSGTLVDVEGDQGLVITNWHVVRDAAGDIEVAFPDGFRSKAKVLKTDRDWDLAALVIWRPNVPPAPLAAQAPAPGEVLTIAGYGSGDFRAATARCTQYVSPGKQLPYEMVEVGTEARQGDSGGPIFNERGEVAGVLFGAGGGTTSGSYVGRVRWFLASVSPRLADPTATPSPGIENIASTNPFVDPHGAARRIAEEEAKATIAAPADGGQTWHARAAEPLPPEDDMRPIPPAPRVEVPSNRIPVTSQISFGGLPDKMPVASALPTEPAEEELLSMWSRPLPQQPACPLAPADASQASLASAAPVGAASPAIASAAPSAELWQSLLGPTLFDQAKSVLAILGVVTVASRLIRSPAPAE